MAAGRVQVVGLLAALVFSLGWFVREVILTFRRS